MVGCHKRCLMWVYLSFPIVFIFWKNNVCYIYQWITGRLWIKLRIGVTNGGVQKRYWNHKIFDYKFWQKKIRAIRHGKLVPGRRGFRPLQMSRQRQLLATSRSRIVQGMFLIREKEIQDPLYLLWKVLVFLPLRRILFTIYIRQLLSFILVAHYHSIRILMIGHG